MICLYLLVKNNLLAQITNRQTGLNTHKVALPQKIWIALTLQTFNLNYTGPLHKRDKLA